MKFLTKTTNGKKNKPINSKLSNYPCINFLHNALRFLSENKIDVAYTEICYAIMKSGGNLTEKEKIEFDNKIKFYD